MQNQFPIKKNLKKFWAGKISFGKSFWLWYFVGGSILSIPFFLITDSAIDSSTGVAVFTVLYFLFFIITLLFLRLKILVENNILESVRNNILGTYNLIKNLNLCNCYKFIFSPDLHF